MSKYYIGSEKKCEQYRAKVTDGESYIERWARLIKHPGLYAILKHEDYESDMKLVENLSKNFTEEE